MKQIFCLGGFSNNTATLAGSDHPNGFLCLADRSGGAKNFNDDGFRFNVIPANGKFRRLTYQVDNAPGSGKNPLVLDVNIAGSAIFPLLTINDPDTLKSQNYNTSVSAGNKAYVRSSYTTGANSPTTGDCSWSIGWESSTAGQAILGHYTCRPLVDMVPLSGTTWYYSIIGDFLSTTESSASLYASLAGTIKSFYVLASRTTFDGSGSMTFSIYKNGAEEASAQVVFNESATSGNVTGLSIAFSAGDTLSFSATGSGTITDAKTGTISFGVMYEPSTDGESIIAGGSSINLTTGTTYFSMNLFETLTAGGAEADRNVTSTGTYTLKDFRINLGTAPGVGKSRTFRVRKNGANTDIVVTISGASTSGTDSTNTATFNTEDLFAISATESGTAANSTMKWSAVMYGVDFLSLNILARPMYTI